MQLTINKSAQRDHQLVLRRIGAYFIDVTLLMLAVQGAQWGLSALTGGFPFQQMATANNGWLIYGWVLLTVSAPIWLYFALFERSARQATPGKRWLGLQVVATDGKKASWGQSLGRTIIKLLPWEIFHLTFMLPVPLLTDPTPAFRPGFVVGFLVLLLYLLVLIQTASQQSIHDLITHTVVIKRAN